MPKSIGRQYHLFDYAGAPDAERVIIVMGSGAETAEETAQYLAAQGEKVGVITVRLFRPFSVKHLLEALPKTVKVIAVLDRTKEPGALANRSTRMLSPPSAKVWQMSTAPFSKTPRIIGGRFGLSSKEFTPAMVKGIFDEMSKAKPKNHFTIGINDDLYPYQPGI